jgi:hypothetical protein
VTFIFLFNFSFASSSSIIVRKNSVCIILYIVVCSLTKKEKTQQQVYFFYEKNSLFFFRHIHAIFFLFSQNLTIPLCTFFFIIYTFVENKTIQYVREVIKKKNSEPNLHSKLIHLLCFLLAF